MNILNFLFKEKHTFDENNPIVDCVTITEEHSLDGRIFNTKYILTGFECTKCGRIFWVDKEDLTHLYEPYCKK